MVWQMVQGHGANHTLQTGIFQMGQACHVTLHKFDIADTGLCERALRTLQHGRRCVQTDKAHFRIQARNLHQLIGRATRQIQHAITRLEDRAHLQGVIQIQKRQHPALIARLRKRSGLRHAFHHQIRLRHPDLLAPRKSLTKKIKQD